MSWDWDIEDVVPDEDDGRMWVPIKPKTLGEEAGNNDAATPPTARAENHAPAASTENRLEMAIYAVADGPEGPIQASSSVHQIVGMPIIVPKVIIRSNEEEPESSQLSELSSLTESSLSQEDTNLGKRKDTPVPHTAKETAMWPKKRQVAKNAPMVTLRTTREPPCDRCKRTGRPCLPRTKGGQALLMCAACFGLKASFRTGEKTQSDGKEKEGLKEEMEEICGSSQVEEGPERPCRQIRQAA